ncbi:hypothetical protein SELMODRAFT_80614 [Selaginella moellendorffii]|uniref:Uncharacterized protein GPAT3-1 n=2 Tax=Selaginella moellendorffii TaxID=88036 RepID=D8QY37_SELML|nr:hypothetical protein SELMODRAFT_102257 [Selaginella moellendorffii]EFJ35135.1 hypothetical protein SELMODRAFT_80614 [Selaginella moellendorffii]
MEHPYDVIDNCSADNREKQSVVADLDGSCVRSRSSFPYFMLVALEGGSLLRSVLLMVMAPVAWLLYHFVSEAAGIKVLIFFSCAGQRARDIEAVARAVLPKFYSEDVHSSTWRVFSSCGKRYILTASPRLMVEHFATTYLGADKVIGTELQVTRSGYATGFVKSPGVLVGVNKRRALKAVFGEEVPDLGIGDRSSDYPFMAFCKEAYIVPSQPADAVPAHKLARKIIFHDGRLVQRPTPFVALVTFLWLPAGFLLAFFRILVALPCPVEYVPLLYKVIGVRLIVKGKVPPPSKNGILFVCTHRTLIDPIMASAASGSDVTALTYSISRVSEVLSPIKTVPLSRDRERDASNIKRLLLKENLAICPEGTTCREPFLLRFSALFAELSENIVPVATSTKTSIFHGTTVRGWKGMDPFFFFMNPFPVYEVTFLERLPHDLSVQGGKSAIEVANYIQRVLADTLGFECTNFTRKDKYGMLIGSDGTVPARKKSF